jgi:hypothetical protein
MMDLLAAVPWWGWVLVAGSACLLAFLVMAMFAVDADQLGGDF